MQLNLGCGNHPAPYPWRNVDFESPHGCDEKVDLRGPLPWPPGSVTHAYLGHVLEHLPIPDVLVLLRRLLACMTADGQVMVVGPDVVRGKAMHSAGLISDDLLRIMGAGAGGHRWSGDVHYWDCEPGLVRQLLTEAGWADVAEVPIGAVPGFWPVVARPEWQCAVSARRGRADQHMCHPSVLSYVAAMLGPEQVAGRWVLEVGSYDVNGTARSVLAPYGPADYVGVDVAAGPGVDAVVECERLAEWAVDTCWDVVVSTEMMEHVRDWQTCLRNMLEVVADGGLLLVTTRSRGFPYHPFPEDNWRYSVAAMGDLVELAGFEVLDLRADPEQPGVFVLARRPDGWEWPAGKTPDQLWAGVDVTPVR